jgi:hypothetical protein
VERARAAGDEERAAAAQAWLEGLPPAVNPIDGSGVLP